MTGLRWTGRPLPSRHVFRTSKPHRKRKSRWSPIRPSSNGWSAAKSCRAGPSADQLIADTGGAMSHVTRVVAAMFVLLVAALPTTAQPYDLVLRNARIVDGTGSPWYRGDIAIRGDTIARIALVISEPAARVIDVNGAVVAPGFIDLHTH